MISENKVEVIPRIPLVKEITVTKDNLSAIGSILRQKGIQNAILLPYNPMGIEKRRIIGRQQSILPEHFMTIAEENAFKKMFYSSFQTGSV